MSTMLSSATFLFSFHLLTGTFTYHSIQFVLVRGSEGIINKMSSQMKSKGTEPSHTARMPIFIGTTLERSKNGQSLFARSY